MSETFIMPPPAESAVKRMPTVYFIDDSATMREVIKIAFRRESIQVITCADAASALAQFEQHRPDAVITDVIMPDQDGYSVCSQIKEHPEFGAIPVVLMSGVVNKSVADKAVAVKADELLRKPFQPQELIARVKTLLGIKDAPAPAPQREQSSPNALQSIFSPPVAVPQNSVVAAPPQTPEPVWPRALAEAFTPLLTAAPANGSSPRPAAPSKNAPLSPIPQPLQTARQNPPFSAEVAKLRGEIARVELLVRKLQNELQLEREY
ncbi:MAG TPA: response regulator, partial [Acidobacteriaceae bacterium]